MDATSSSGCSGKSNRLVTGTSSDPDRDTADIVYSYFDSLVKSAKNFNLHMSVMKRLLNLETPQEGYAPGMNPPDSRDLETGVQQQQEVVLNMGTLQEKISLIRKEMDEMQVNGFCLAFNLQRQLKRLTGLPLDANATDDVVQNLWIRFNESKSSEAILKYEFEEKRKLLRRLRKELEQARRDWKNLKIRITDPSDAADNEWSEASQDSVRLSSESDSAVHSDEGDDEQLLSSASFQSKSKQLGQLEKECLQFVTQLVTSGGSVPSDSSSRLQVTDEDDERFHSPMPVPSDFYIHGQLLIHSPSEEDGSVLTVESDSELDDDDDDDIDLEAALAAEGGLSAFVDDLLNAGASSVSSQLTPTTPDMQAVSLDPEASIFQRSRASSRSSRFDEEEEARLRQESLAETGEPIVLCRLRRKAVEVLVSRLREEKAFHETREKELEGKLKDITARNKRLEDQKRKLSQLFL